MCKIKILFSATVAMIAVTVFVSSIATAGPGQARVLMQEERTAHDVQRD